MLQDPRKTALVNPQVLTNHKGSPGPFPCSLYHHPCAPLSVPMLSPHCPPVCRALTYERLRGSDAHFCLIHPMQGKRKGLQESLLDSSCITVSNTTAPDVHHPEDKKAGKVTRVRRTVLQDAKAWPAAEILTANPSGSFGPDRGEQDQSTLLGPWIRGSPSTPQGRNPL